MDRAFRAAEANDPALLLKYGRYVRGRPLEEPYTARVRRRVRELTDFVTRSLPATVVWVRALTSQGYRSSSSSVRASGNTPRWVPRCRLSAPTWTAPDPAPLHAPFEPREGKARVACVPPFDIVDLTCRRRLVSRLKSGRPAPVLAEGVPTEAAVTLDELAEPELLALFRRDRGRAGRLDDFANLALRDYWTGSPARIVTTPTVRLKYIECDVMTSDGAPLESMQNLVLSGCGPRALHTDFLAQHPRA